MKFRFPFYRIRTAFAAWKNSDPKQAGRLGTVVRFFAVMLILTLTARGIAGASMPKVTLGQASAGSITQSSTASGTISVQGGTPLTVPEGLLVAQVTATTGQTLSKGDAIARFDEVSLAQALATKQAQVKQLEVSAMQLSDPDKADGFALQQAQQQLERAYSDAQKTWQDGENAIEKARQQRDAAQNALNALQNQPVALPKVQRRSGNRKLQKPKPRWMLLSRPLPRHKKMLKTPTRQQQTLPKVMRMPATALHIRIASPRRTLPRQMRQIRHRLR